MQLVQGAQFLVREIGAAASLAELYQSPQSVTAVLGAADTPARALQFTSIEAIRAASAILHTHHHPNSGHVLPKLLVTAQQRLAAVQRAAGLPAGAAGTLGDVAAAAPATGAAGGSYSAAPAAKPGWCPTHTSGPAPSAISEAENTPLAALIRRIMFITHQVQVSMGTPVWLSRCNHIDCRNMSGPSDAALVTGGRGVVCSGCGVARFCSVDCADKAWPAHSKACGRLAAALGHGDASGSSNSCSHRSTATTNSNQRSTAGSGSASSSCLYQAAAADQGAAISSSSSSASSRDTVTAGDQSSQAHAPAGRVCAWCGQVGKELLRCGRCKAAWYCGVDHQRAAWKAGHKQECGAAAAAVSEQKG
jgi:hypothetical protein